MEQITYSINKHQQINFQFTGKSNLFLSQISCIIIFFKDLNQIQAKYKLNVRIDQNVLYFYLKMYQLPAQKIVVLYIENNSMGVSIYDSDKSVVNCGKILQFYYGDKDLIGDILSSATEIITNHPKQHILVEYQNKITHFKRQLLDQTIFTMLAQIPFKNNESIKNKQHYFNLMLEDSIFKFKALGILLYHLMNFTAIFKRTILFFQEIEYWNDYIFEHLQISQSQTEYLQISKGQFHPSYIKSRSQNILGNSLHRIFNNFLRTKGGKKIMKRLILNPTYKKSEIIKRHNILDWMIRNMKDSNTYSKYFKNIYSIDSILQRDKKNKIEGDDWKKIMKSIQSIIQLKKILPLNNAPQIVKDFLNDQNWPEINEISSLINKIIQISPLGIKEDYDEQLKQLKILHFQMPKILFQILKRQKWGVDSKLIFISQIGYLVQVPQQAQIQQKEDWQLKFTNFNGQFYSNQITKQLDEQYGDVDAAIKDIQTRILDQFEQYINQRSQILINIYWKACVIECYWGISQLMKNMTIPKVSEEQLIIINGWNIMLGQKALDNHAFSFSHQKGPKQKVFNSQLNIVNTNYTNRCQMISGPNGSGKTIYMKQIGAIIYLAHCGFLVPATFAQIPLFDRIVVVETSGSIFSKQTGFEKQLISLSKIMTKNIITNKSLVLIDQIGLSQDYTIGLKLLYACVKYLANNDVQKFSKNKLLSQQTNYFNIPLTLIITHLTQLMVNQLIQENYFVRYLTMDVTTNFDFLYKIKPGLVKSGYGIKSAEGFLKDQKIIENAYHFWKKLK